ECGSLNEWLALAPHADVICGQIGSIVSVNDFIGGQARALADGETVSTGKYRFRYCRTPHLPHGWDAGLLFEETQGTLFCSDLFHQSGRLEPLTAQNLSKLAALQPKLLATMHGSSFRGDGARALAGLGEVLREVFGPDPSSSERPGAQPWSGASQP